jgi:hypothetical protein
MARFDSSAVLAGFLLLFGSGCTQTLDFDATSSEAGSKPAFSCADHVGPSIAFCDDFEGKPAPELWGRLTTSTGTPGSIATDELDSLSPTHSLLVSYQGMPASAAYTAIFAYKDFPDYASTNISIAIGFDMKVEVVDTTANSRVSAFQFLFGQADPLSQLVLNLESKSTEVSAEFTENASNSATTTDPADRGTINTGLRDGPTLNQWAHVRFELDVNQPTGITNSAKLYIDEEKLFDGALQKRLYGLTPRMELGLPYVDVAHATSPWRIRYDNMLVTITRK